MTLEWHLLFIVFLLYHLLFLVLYIVLIFFGFGKKNYPSDLVICVGGKKVSPVSFCFWQKSVPSSWYCKIYIGNFPSSIQKNFEVDVVQWNQFYWHFFFILWFCYKFQAKLLAQIEKIIQDISTIQLTQLDMFIYG